MKYMSSNENSGIGMKIAQKFADILIKGGVEQQGCIGLFTYETEIPLDVLLSEKDE